MKKDEVREVLMDVLVHLIAATSAYEHFAGNSKRSGRRDALYSTKLDDYQKSIERGRKAYREWFGKGT